MCVLMRSYDNIMKRLGESFKYKSGDKLGRRNRQRKPAIVLSLFQIVLLCFVCAVCLRRFFFVCLFCGDVVTIDLFSDLYKTNCAHFLCSMVGS